MLKNNNQFKFFLVGCIFSIVGFFAIDFFFFTENQQPSDTHTQNLTDDEYKQTILLHIKSERVGVSLPDHEGVVFYNEVNSSLTYFLFLPHKMKNKKETIEYGRSLQLLNEFKDLCEKEIPVAFLLIPKVQIVTIMGVVICGEGEKRDTVFLMSACYSRKPDEIWAWRDAPAFNKWGGKDILLDIADSFYVHDALSF